MKKLGKVSLIGIAALIALLTAFGIGYASRDQDTPKTAVAASVQATPPTRAELLALVNAERAKVGVAPLQENPLFDQSAQWKADDMATNKYFGHVKPGTTGNDGLDYLNSLKPPCHDISENLHWGTGQDVTAKATIADLMTSKPHREAMLNPKYTLTGFGIASANGKIYMAEHFCQP